MATTVTNLATETTTTGATEHTSSAFTPSADAWLVVFFPTWLTGSGSVAPDIEDSEGLSWSNASGRGGQSGVSTALGGFDSQATVWTAKAAASPPEMTVTVKSHATRAAEVGWMIVEITGDVAAAAPFIECLVSIVGNGGEDASGGISETTDTLTATPTGKVIAGFGFEHNWNSAGTVWNTPPTDWSEVAGTTIDNLDQWWLMELLETTSAHDSATHGITGDTTVQNRAMFIAEIDPGSADVTVTPERAELSLEANALAVVSPVTVTPERAELSLEANALAIDAPITVDIERAELSLEANAVTALAPIEVTPERAELALEAYGLLIDSPVEVTPERAELALEANALAGSVPVAVDIERAELALEARSPQSITSAAVSFPWPESGRLQVTLEAEINGTWTDIGEYQVGELTDLVINLARGRADLAAETEPSELGTMLDASNGELMPSNPMSSLWPYWRVGTQIRLSVDGETPALRLFGGTAVAPHHTDFDITGDLDVRVRLDPDRWAHAAEYTAGGLSLGSAVLRIASRWLATGDERSWGFAVFGPGKPAFEWSPDGTQGASIFDATDQLVAALKPIWLGATIDVDDGAGGHVVTLWRSDAETPPTDITDWDIIDTFETAGTTSIHAGAANLILGGIAGLTTFDGRILAFELRDGINAATPVAEIDFSTIPPGSTGFIDDAGKTWALSGDAEITRRQIIYVGDLTELLPIWPYGDHNPTIDLDDDRPPTEARVAVTASGMLHRLNQGQNPIRSSLYRHIASIKHSDEVAGYWPCEDGENAALIASGLPDGPQMTTTGLTLAADDSLPASAPLPTIDADEAVTWSATVPSIGTDDAWVVEWFTLIPTGATNPATTRLMTIHAAADAATWHIDLSDTNITLTALDSVGATLDTATVAHSGDLLGRWILLRLDVAQDGADIDYQLSFVSIDLGAGGSLLADTIASQTLGRVTSITGDTTGPPDGLSFGHIIATNGDLTAGWLAGADTAWAGESAAHRFWRLCAEEGIPAEIIGDPGPIVDLRGDLSASQAMGPQQLKTFVELLIECVVIDLGVLLERRAVPGLVFRCRNTIEDQDVVLTLDASQGDIVHPLEPSEDTYPLRNDITVTSATGSSAQVIDQDSIDNAGTYDDSVEIAGVGGLAIQAAIIAAQDGLATAIANQNLQQAAWRLTLGTTEGLRYATLVIDFQTMADDRAREQIDAWLQTTLGDRVQLSGLPVQVPDEPVELIIDHIVQDIRPISWTVELTCSPGDPWLTGEMTE